MSSGQRYKGRNPRGSSQSQPSTVTYDLLKSVYGTLMMACEAVDSDGDLEFANGLLGPLLNNLQTQSTLSFSIRAAWALMPQAQTMLKILDSEARDDMLHLGLFLPDEEFTRYWTSPKMISNGIRLERETNLSHGATAIVNFRFMLEGAPSQPTRMGRSGGDGQVHEGRRGHDQSSGYRKPRSAVAGETVASIPLPTIADVVLSDAVAAPKPRHRGKGKGKKQAASEPAEDGPDTTVVDLQVGSDDLDLVSEKWADQVEEELGVL